LIVPDQILIAFVAEFGGEFKGTVPNRILVAFVAEIGLYEFWRFWVPITEFQRILEEVARGAATELAKGREDGRRLRFGS
jgi:hypothetical protein